MHLTMLHVYTFTFLFYSISEVVNCTYNYPDKYILKQYCQDTSCPTFMENRRCAKQSLVCLYFWLKGGNTVKCCG